MGKEPLEDGLLRIREAARKQEKILRDQRKTEEAHRIASIIKEFAEGLEEGFVSSGLDSYLTYFCQETVSFREYFPQGQTAVFLDEPARLKEKGETVESEFRESMIHRLEKGFVLP